METGEFLLRTSLVVPQARARRVARPRLVVRLNQGLKDRLTLAVVGLVLAPLRRIGISGFLAGGRFHTSEAEAGGRTPGLSQGGPLPRGIGRLG